MRIPVYALALVPLLAGCHEPCATIGAPAPAAVATALVRNATADKIMNPGPGGPNFVLYAGYVPASTTAHVDSQPTQPPTLDATDGIAELPRVYRNTAVSNMPSDGRTIRVPAGDANGLQAALDTSALGDKILLAAGARFVANFTVRPSRPARVESRSRRDPPPVFENQHHAQRVELAVLLQ